MFSGVKTAAFMASAGSGIAIIVSLIVIGNLFMEVNDMYREVLAEMDEFKATTWGVQCALCLLLAVNRFVDLCIGRNANEALFSGSRTNIWCALAACYGIILVFVPPTLVFSSTLGSLFYDPYVGFENITEVDRSWYFNPIMGINNIATVSSLFVLYTAMLITITLKSMRSGGNVHIQISIFYQAALICLLNAVPALEYLYMQFFSAPQWLIAAGHFGWQASNGGPAFIYVFFNKTIQRNVLKMFGMKGRTATISSILPTSHINLSTIKYSESIIKE
ncbi:hypothetical protein QR680_015916 [Steinernema hermaphroditum]|uniref:Nematode cuticle collagen N-terminal domain-containing protein n=1 Tax=Steinernema hermaphroditum TaxID=289476 RepID=A0AA39LLF2_9BILA|nr:hypothetical protein QR680_015916 [Steinernema hermaphroditum]